jgi:tetratricopeptide (TPR) repeat protein
MEKGLQLQIDARNPVAMSMMYHGVGMVLCDLGDLQRARENLERALELSTENNEKMYEGMARSTLGKVIAKADHSQAARAESLAWEGINILHGLKLKPLVSQAYMDLSQIYAHTGQQGKAQMVQAKAQELMFG